MADVTSILRSIDDGDVAAAEQLLPLVYDELRRLAAARMASERPGSTISATCLVHDAYLRLVGSSGAEQDTGRWEGRGHFFAAAAEAMRRILVERARRKAAVKHGGELRRVELDIELVVDDQQADELLALDEALSELERHDPQAAQLVKLRYFAGMSHDEAAQALHISRRAADRLWALAKAWLYQKLNTNEGDPSARRNQQ